MNVMKQENALTGPCLSVYIHKKSHIQRRAVYLGSVFSLVIMYHGLDQNLPVGYVAPFYWSICALP